MTRKPKGRLVVVENLYHQPEGEQPRSIDAAPWSAELKSDEQMYGPRRCKATTDWQPLECGWITVASQVHITNMEGSGLQKIPTLEERLAIEEKIILLGIDLGDRVEPTDKILPGRSIRTQPFLLERLRIRCTVGEAKFFLSIFPE